MQDAHNAEKDPDDQTRSQLRQDMAQEIKKIRGLLRKSSEDSV